MEYQKFIPEGWNEGESAYTLSDLKEALDERTILSGKVLECDSNNNLHVKFGDSITGIVPRQEFEYINVDDYGYCNPKICKGKVGSYINFRVKEICDDKKVILSRKDVQKDAINWVKEELKPGMVVSGIVKNIRKFGAFIEIGGGVVGLLHIEDISISRIKSPEERLSIGQKIDVMIKYVDVDRNKIVLTYKELLGDWDSNVKDYAEKTVVEGIVKEADQYKNGIFIELTPNLVGLAEYKEGLEYGQKVNVYIKKIMKDRKKIKLLII